MDDCCVHVFNWWKFVKFVARGTKISGQHYKLNLYFMYGIHVRDDHKFVHNIEKIDGYSYIHIRVLWLLL